MRNSPLGEDNMDEKALAKDELIGLKVKVKESDDPSWNNISGTIVDETKNTFTIEIKDKQKMIAKKTAKFEFQIQDKKITIDGSKIMYRPEDRIKKIR
jgi:ribonuclease P protein subunit POP4